MFVYFVCRFFCRVSPSRLSVHLTPYLKIGRIKSPEGTAPEREIPLIGVAGVSLRGLGSPEEGEQKTFLVTLLQNCYFVELGVMKLKSIGVKSFTVKVASVLPPSITLKVIPKQQTILLPFGIVNPML